MKTTTPDIKSVAATALLLSICLSLKAQVKEGLPPADDLYKKVQQLDSLVFGAFNSRDTTAFDQFFSRSLEFYHDKGGLTGYTETASFLKSQMKTDLRRSLLKESLEVYPIPGYGAMEIGEHEFIHTENGRPVTGRFKFLHVWKNENGKWTITRVISYGH